jgi:L-fuculose-phosphate aldolase
VSTKELREKLATACRVIAAAGHEDLIWGHLSVRDPEAPDRFWMKGAGISMLDVGPDDMVLVDLDGKQLAGDRACHIEWPIHSEVLRRRPEVNTVLHTHPFYTTIVASLDAPLVPGAGWATLFGLKDVPRFLKTSYLIDSQELGVEMTETMGDHNLLLLRNHGIVLAADNIEAITFLSVRVEKIAQAQLIAMSTGAPMYTPTQEEIEGRDRQVSVLSNLNPRWLWEHFERHAPPVRSDTGH